MIADQTWDTILNMILNNFDKTSAKLYYSQTGSLQLISINTLVLSVFWQSGPCRPTYMKNLICAIDFFWKYNSSMYIIYRHNMHVSKMIQYDMLIILLTVGHRTNMMNCLIFLFHPIYKRIPSTGVFTQVCCVFKRYFRFLNEVLACVSPY